MADPARDRPGVRNREIITDYGLQIMVVMNNHFFQTNKYAGTGAEGKSLIVQAVPKKVAKGGECLSGELNVSHVSALFQD